MKTKYEKMTDKKLMNEINKAIGVWQVADINAQFKEEIVKELREIQVKRLMEKWRKKSEEQEVKNNERS